MKFVQNLTYSDFQNFMFGHTVTIMHIHLHLKLTNPLSMIFFARVWNYKIEIIKENDFNFKKNTNNFFNEIFTLQWSYAV
jgi:hypothetical protein